MNMQIATFALCMMLCHHVTSIAQTVIPALRAITAPPSDPAVRGWQLRDASEGAAYLAHKLVEDALPADERGVVQERLRSTLDDLTFRLSDGAWWKPSNGSQGDPNLNRFVLTALLDTLWTLRKEPDFEASWHRWASRLRTAMDLQIKAYRGEVVWDWGATSAYRYPNQDVLYALSAAISAQLFSDKNYAAEAEKAIQSLQRNQMPGGGWHYIAGEAESPIYHALVQAVLARYVDVTGDSRARLMLERSVEYWHAVLSAQGVAEGWSDVWWKQNWLPIPSVVVRTAAIAANDAELTGIAQTMAARESRRPFRVTWAESYTQAWQKLPAPMPVLSSARTLAIDADHYGAHGRDGDWYFGVTKGRGLRNTFVGAMVSSGDDAMPLASAFRGAHVIVVDGNAARTQYALSQQTDRTELSIQSKRALLSARYQLQPKRINGVPSPQDVDSPWAVQQLWSAGSDGVMGSVELKAIRDNAATAVIGRLLFGPCPVIAEGPSTWRCGGMRIRVFEAWGEAKVTPIGAAYRSQVDQWEGIEWQTTLQGTQAGAVFRYRVWVGPVEAAMPNDLALVSDGWVARWDGDRNFQARLLDGALRATESNTPLQSKGN